MDLLGHDRTGSCGILKNADTWRFLLLLHYEKIHQRTKTSQKRKRQKQKGYREKIDMQYVNLILSSKIFFEKKSEFENQINLIKYAPMTEIQTILYLPPPLIHLTKKIRVNLKITNLDSGIKILSVES